eukprot:9495317-Pyramimonas_sp.AAC.1
MHAKHPPQLLAVVFFLYRIQFSLCTFTHVPRCDTQPLPDTGTLPIVYGTFLRCHRSGARFPSKPPVACQRHLHQAAQHDLLSEVWYLRAHLPTCRPARQHTRGRVYTSHWFSSSDILRVTH